MIDEPKKEKLYSIKNKKQKIFNTTLQAAHGLSLGISMVVAVLIGIGIGYLLKKFTPYPWLFWLGVFWGISATILNVYKAYKSQVKSYMQFQQRDDFIKKIKKKS
ncbi:AtpZ/AtpI family protein [Campylobacter sp. VicNov18]|uniref:AtpZ/AtpI family protein n=1 Tax=Campylobacter bilis TaxID=2691918 RepID=UPI00130DE42E|nr:AtpZ/AtpI family protein [Campylobacter bilis]MPV63543.1 hypothetical protein [Campylobacter hepaticus]MBM0637043.1 hypothetical protein [Campylobacter bilis]MCC8277800.1 AtpZ/AtpI family protein [Campylobacter bilis]MCC8299409.1 AtpZ/AtpI family protein [Campylobacter bilis]MCC8300709.1 AtpZ/AtpI family protein [Campylobacter bilis]